MSPKTLRDELKMSKPFKSVEEEAILSIARTAAVLEHAGRGGAEAVQAHDHAVQRAADSPRRRETLGCAATKWGSGS